MNQFFDTFYKNIDVYVVGIVFLSGFFQKNYLQGFSWSKVVTYDGALKTLALSFVVSFIYILLIKDPSKGDNWSKYFLSYFTATSLYELLIEPITNWIKTKVS